MKTLNRKKRLAFQSDENKSILQILKYCIVFTLFFFASSLLIVLLASLALFNTGDPSKYLSIVLKIVLYSSVFICSLALVKKLKQSYFITGLIFGCIISILLFILSKASGGGGLLIWYALIPVFSVFGALSGIKREPKRGKRRHKHIN
ncbi:MAG: TIGR04086 family membrane protein [Clostridia bacterium]|nr:TIGR04086 family membrane protein [Clostridia bacterium]